MEKYFEILKKKKKNIRPKDITQYIEKKHSIDFYFKVRFNSIKKDYTISYLRDSIEAEEDLILILKKYNIVLYGSIENMLRINIVKALNNNDYNEKFVSFPIKDENNIFCKSCKLFISESILESIFFEDYNGECKLLKDILIKL